MTRDEEIGRAAWDADGVPAASDEVDVEKLTLMAYTTIGLAAVSRAREIDTCDTCNHYSFGDESDGYYKWCNLHKETTDMIDGCGCNRHQPKDET